MAPTSGKTAGVPKVQITKVEREIKMKLKDVITGRQLVTLIDESETEIALALHDPDTGEMLRVDIKADAVAIPDELLLFVEVHGLEVQTQDVSNRVNLADWWSGADVLTEGEPPTVFTRAEPDQTWMVTPDGREFDLRVREGGLF